MESGHSLRLSRKAKALFVEMRERPELDRDALAEAREEGHGHFIAGLAALRAAAGRQGGRRRRWIKTRSKRD